MGGSGHRLPDAIFYGGVGVFLALLVFVSRGDVGLIRGCAILFGGTLLIGTLAAVVWVTRHLWQTPTTPTALELSLRFESVRFMDGARFEGFIADLFRAMGHRVVLCGGAGDQGVDMVVYPRGERVAVQCKNHSRPVGNRPVQEVYAGARHHRCVEAWVVAPAGYTSGARDLAKSTGVSLYDADAIRQWIKNVDRTEKQLAGETHPQFRSMQTASKKASWYPHPDDPPGRQDN
jgi:HJR/Mrr/RecB family endonuclease